jgi:hypothetical protein
MVETLTSWLRRMRIIQEVLIHLTDVRQCSEKIYDIAIKLFNEMPNLMIFLVRVRQAIFSLPDLETKKTYDKLKEVIHDCVSEIQTQLLDINERRF